jgi:serine protease Do
MKKNFCHRLPSGLAILGMAFGLNLLNAISPFELLSLTQLGQRNPQTALAQAKVKQDRERRPRRSEENQQDQERRPRRSEETEENQERRSQDSEEILQDPEEIINVRVYRMASPAVVSIETDDGASGSGSIISSDGLILTNAHVVSGSQAVTVILPDGQELKGDVIAFGESGLDLAAIRLQGEPEDLPTIELAPPRSLEVGQRTFAIGNPFGQFQGTFTTGVISRVDLDRGLIQTDAAINPGNSGGPLLNSQGQLIGVNSAIFTQREDGGNIGIGFAISADRAQSFLVAVREGRAPREPQQSPLLGGSGRPAEQVTLNGQTIQGQLSNRSDILPSDGSYFNAYTFEGQQGQQVEIEMRSQDFDAYLILLAPDGRSLQQDDDSAGNTDARISVTLPETGNYTVLANSFERRQTGRYTIRFSTGTTTPPSPGTPGRPQPSPSPDQPPQGTPGRPQPSPGQPPSGRPPATPGQPPGSPSTPPSGPAILQEQGTLGPGAPVLQSDGSLYREHTFEGRSGQNVTISMESGDFDTYLILVGPDGSKIAENDDASPDTLNSSISVTLPENGTYRIIANALDRTGRGNYTLTVR